MTTLVLDIHDSRPVAAHCDATHLHVTLADGRELATPIDWYPRLREAANAARNHIEFLPMGLHWPDLDEDISIASMLRGERAPEPKSAPGPTA